MLTSRDVNHPGNLAILVFDLWACNVSAKLLHGDGFVCIIQRDVGEQAFLPAT